MQVWSLLHMACVSASDEKGEVVDGGVRICPSEFVPSVHRPSPMEKYRLIERRESELIEVCSELCVVLSDERDGIFFLHLCPGSARTVLMSVTPSCPFTPSHNVVVREQ